MLDKMYSHVELVQLIVIQGDWDTVKKNTLTVDRIVMENKWDNVKNRPQTA